MQKVVTVTASAAAATPSVTNEEQKMPEAAEVVEAQEVHCTTVKLHMRILAMGV